MNNNTSRPNPSKCYVCGHSDDFHVGTITAWVGWKDEENKVPAEERWRVIACPVCGTMRVIAKG